ncbi:MAG: MBL fold metallo-hydrolase [Candidatus Eremiobacteraeota bacterium]|nr:MBL fold metallo-hydrolase [Candidatus Eremiobacteraeota bacterium]
MTLSGTNSYLVGDVEGVICIDPGPGIAKHVDRLIAESPGPIRWIVLTHGHPDHAPAAAPLRAKTGAIVAAHPRSAVPHDRALDEGDVVECGTTRLQVVHAPGHTFEHVVLFEPQERALFTGDVILGEGTVVIAPPAGEMRAYQATLDRLLRDFSNARTIYGGHGDEVTDPRAKIAEYIEHRKIRERELLGALAEGSQTIPDLVKRIYAQTPRVLWPAAARQMLAYLLALEREGRVTSVEAPRAPNADEHAILNPEWSSMVGEDEARVIEAELGAQLRLDALRVYTLTR